MRPKDPSENVAFLQDMLHSIIDLSLGEVITYHGDHQRNKVLGGTQDHILKGA